MVGIEVGETRSAKGGRMELSNCKNELEEIAEKLFGQIFSQ